MGQNKKPLFSILSAARNNHAFLGGWVKSLLTQKYRPLEVVLVDDHSNRKTQVLIPEIEKKFQDAGIDFKYIFNTKRMYCGTSYRTACNNSKGKFIGVVDADDMLHDGAVGLIMDIYLQNPDIGWIYTQFDMHNLSMGRKNKGFCKAPKPGQTLLSMGQKRMHAYSHWRTFSRRIHKVGKVFKPGLRSAIDKYMGYLLEELAPGMFVPKVCYKYRHGVKGSISKCEQTISTWKSVMNEAVARRRKNNITPYPIRTYKFK